MKEKIIADDCLTTQAIRRRMSGKSDLQRSKAILLRQ